MTPPPQAPESAPLPAWSRGALAIGALLALCIGLYWPYATSPTLWTDVISYLRESYSGDMPWGSLESHRPFRTITWNILAPLSLYSKNGLLVIVLGLHFVCSLLVYLILARLMPERRGIAFATAALRLTWTTAIVEGTDDLILEALFPETLFVIATYIWVRMETASPRPAFAALSRASIAALVFLAMGMYEQVWANIALLPVVLVISGVASLTRAGSIRTLGIWYLSVAAFLFLYLIHFGNFGKPPTKLESPELYADIWYRLTDILVVEPFEALIRFAGLLKSAHYWIPCAAGIVAAATVWIVGTGRAPDLTERRASVRALVAGIAWFVLGYIPLVIGLASSYGNIAIWGTRYLLSMSYPSVLVTVSLVVAAIWSVARTGGRGAIAAVLGLTVALNAVIIVAGWNTFVQQYKPLEDVDIALSATVPSVLPDTVLIMEDESQSLKSFLKPHERDLFDTFVRRNYYGVRSVYVFHATPERPVIWTDGAFRLKTIIVYPASEETLPDYTGIGINKRYLHPQLWEKWDDGPVVREVSIDPELVVWLRYRDGAFEIVPERSNTGRIRQVLDPVHKGILGIDEDLIRPGGT